MIANNNVVEGGTSHNVSCDQSGRSKWSHEQVENSNANRLFFSRCKQFSDLVTLLQR